MFINSWRDKNKKKQLTTVLATALSRKSELLIIAIGAGQRGSGQLLTHHHSFSTSSPLHSLLPFSSFWHYFHTSRVCFRKMLGTPAESFSTREKKAESENP